MSAQRCEHTRTKWSVDFKRGHCEDCGADVSEPRIGHGGYPVPRRCGSYPLMNLAADYGVAYGDVLVWADYMRANRALREPWRQGRFELAAEAFERIRETIGCARFEALAKALIAHADARWGRRAA